MENIKQILKNRIFYYYFFLIVGAIWHITGLIQEIMSILSSFTIIIISLISIFLFIKKETKNYLFVLLIFIISFLAEYIGVKTGILFGNYSYSDELLIQINNVPIAIGFAWLSTLFTSFSLTIKTKISGLFSIAGLNAFLMTIFDYFLEPAAIKLNYWQWNNVKVPIFNYATWFLLSFIFSIITIKYIKRNEDISELKHLYFSQLIYFILIWLFV